MPQPALVAPSVSWLAGRRSAARHRRERPPAAAPAFPCQVETYPAPLQCARTSACGNGDIGGSGGRVVENVVAVDILRRVADALHAAMVQCMNPTQGTWACASVRCAASESAPSSGSPCMQPPCTV
eukprot:365640-Chlamydomonas_euryale.AAC.2